MTHRVGIAEPSFRASTGKMGISLLLSGLEEGGLDVEGFYYGAQFGFG